MNSTPGPSILPFVCINHRVQLEHHHMHAPITHARPPSAADPLVPGWGKDWGYRQILV